MITVHHLNNSRSQRILWLCEELGLDYTIRHYTRDATTNLAPPELKQIHPLGKSPVIDDHKLRLSESGAIVDYIIRVHGGIGRLVPPVGTAAHEYYVEWLHFAEGSAMLPHLLLLYSGRLGDAAGPLMPRIMEQLGAHLDYFDAQLGDHDWLVDNTLSGADILMSFVAEIAAAQGQLKTRPRLVDYVRRIQSRPAWKAALAKSAPYSFTLPD